MHDTVYRDKRQIDVKPVNLMANYFRLSRSEQVMQLPLKFLEIVHWLPCLRWTPFFRPKWGLAKVEPAGLNTSS